ncbi:MAG: N-acetylneuraminate synthase, partial [Leifsonia flava]
MTLTIGTHTVGPGHPVYVIGEIGLNHNGDVAL